MLVNGCGQRQDSGEYIWIDGRERQNEGKSMTACWHVFVVFHVAMRCPREIFRGWFENTDSELKGKRWALADS